MTLFAAVSLLVSLFCFILSLIIFKYAYLHLHRIWALFNLGVCSWSLGLFLVGISRSSDEAVMSWRYAYGTGAFVIAGFYHFMYILCGLKDKSVLQLIHALAIVFSLIIFFSPRFINTQNIILIHNEIYYHQATLLYSIFMGYLTSVVGLAFAELIRYLRGREGNKRTQAIYLFIGFSVGWAGGFTTFMPAYGVSLYPAWHLSVCFYTLLLTYAVFKHQVLDIRIALTRLMIFVFVYTLVLGIPFILAFGWQAELIGLLGQNWWIIPLVTATILATVGPYAYIFIQRKSESRLLEEVNKAKQRLYHVEKLAYIGQLASSIVHEIRNPLTSIKTFVHYLPEKVRAQDSVFLEKFEAIIPNEINRLEKIVQQLLNLARPRVLNKQRIRLSGVMDITLELLKEKIHLRGVQIERNYLAENDTLSADKDQIQQVLLNLVLNALDAMKNGGYLTIKLWQEIKEDSNNCHLMLSVKDTGCGMSPNDLKNIFVPFHTTKKDGVGLGLIITQEIINLHEGEVKVVSEIGRGTEFIITLPVK